VTRRRLMGDTKVRDRDELDGGFWSPHDDDDDDDDALPGQLVRLGLVVNRTAKNSAEMEKWAQEFLDHPVEVIFEGEEPQP
jgi:hypothetical protein